jgi:nucleotide sugar dehydrogenase
VIVLGQGYVGLPVAMRAVMAGYDVIGLELDRTRSGHLAAGQSYVNDVPDPVLLDALDTGRYLPTPDYSSARRFDYAVITVPTPLTDGAPDLSFVESAARTLAPYITRGATVILESTTYPGTTEDLVRPILESGSGLTAGDDFALGYSPERIDPGNSRWNFQNTPKVVAGITEHCTRKISAFYANLVDQVVEVSSPRAAEMTKLLENSFRHVNIALVNELAKHSHALGINLWEVIDAAATKPFGYMPFWPGPGVGGHCLPIDPTYLGWDIKRRTGESFRFVDLANEVNRGMPGYVVTRIVAALNRSQLSVAGRKLLLIGLAYKPNTGDVRESPAARVASQLTSLGADVEAIEPFAKPSDCPDGVRLVELTAERAASADLIVVLTNHHGIDYEIIEKSETRTLDTRHCVEGPMIEHL